MLLPRLVTPASGEVVALADVKQHLRVDHGDEDALIAALVAAAAARVEQLTERLLTQTWKAFFPRFDLVMRLPYRPVSAVTAVTYFDAGNVEATLAAPNYLLLEDHRSPFVTPAVDGDWPGSLADRADAVAITFTAGHGAAANIPAPLRHAILLMAGDLYEHRETVAAGAAASEIPMPASAMALLEPYRSRAF